MDLVAYVARIAIKKIETSPALNKVHESEVLPL